METTPLTRRLNPLDVPLDRLVANPNVSEPDKRRAAARAFEAILLRQILESAQKTVIPSSVSQDSATKSIYRDLITTQLADAISRSGQFGLAQSFAQQWEPASASKGLKAFGSAVTPAATLLETPRAKPPLAATSLSSEVRDE